jgi:CheY-like chemotaxis protein
VPLLGYNECIIFVTLLFSRNLWEKNIMRILILEDSVERQEQFYKNLINYDVEITDSSKTAIQKLSNEKWDILFLDHDLGGEAYVPSGENTGYEVAKFLEENQQFMPRNIVVHSLNSVGAKNINDALPNAVRIPFAWTKENLKKIKLC